MNRAPLRTRSTSFGREARSSLALIVVLMGLSQRSTQVEHRPAHLSRRRPAPFHRTVTTHFKLGPGARYERPGDPGPVERVCAGPAPGGCGYAHIVVEGPPGRPQIEDFDRGYRWQSHGAV